MTFRFDGATHPLGLRGFFALPTRRRFELLVFAMLAILVWPVATVGVVGGWGFAVWMYQQVYGPPGPAGR